MMMKIIHTQQRDHSTWEQRYAAGMLPWDTGEADPELKKRIQTYGISPCPALEIGCGTGTNTIWLAQQGFSVTALDIAQNAIEMARQKSVAAGVHCSLFVGDFLNDDISNAPFGFVYDRGVFHVFKTTIEQERFASRVASLLAPNGIWHSLIGSTDGPPRDVGPPRHSAREIVAAVEPSFEILELRSTTFDTSHHSDARAWVLVARKREL